MATGPLGLLCDGRGGLSGVSFTCPLTPEGILLPSSYKTNKQNPNHLSSRKCVVLIACLFGSTVSVWF